MGIVDDTRHATKIVNMIGTADLRHPVDIKNSMSFHGADLM
jgi:hypothetical protein